MPYSRNKIFAVTAAGLVFAFQAALAANWFVSPDGNDANPGANWSAAKQTLQSAVNAAANNGDIIWATKAQYKKFNRAYDPQKYYEHVINLPDQPAVLVSWEDANNYCGWLNRNYRGQLPPGCEFRLPTEKEWTAFARFALSEEAWLKT